MAASRSLRGLGACPLPGHHSRAAVLQRLFEGALDKTVQPDSGSSVGRGRPLRTSLGTVSADDSCGARPTIVTAVVVARSRQGPAGDVHYWWRCPFGQPLPGWADA